MWKVNRFSQSIPTQAFVEAKIRAASELRKRAKRSPWLPVGPGILEKVGSVNFNDWITWGQSQFFNQSDSVCQLFFSLRKVYKMAFELAPQYVNLPQGIILMSKLLTIS